MECGLYLRPSNWGKVTVSKVMQSGTKVASFPTYKKKERDLWSSPPLWRVTWDDDLSNAIHLWLWDGLDSLPKI